MGIFKIFRMNEWSEFQRIGVFKGSPDDLRDGFIHFSTEDHLLGTLARYFKTDHELVIAKAENDGWGDMMKWEAARGRALFPHLYGYLYLHDISQFWSLSRVGTETWNVSQISNDLNISFAPSDI